MILQDKPRSGAAAFTLIELLVVVAIIAVLISILLPSLSLARKQAKQLLCNTRLREQGKAMMFYAQENRDTIVRAEVDFGEWGADMHFASTLLPGLGYDGPVHNLWRAGNQGPFREVVSKTETLQCPSFPNPEQDLDFVVSSFPMPYPLSSINRDNDGGQPGERARGQSDLDAVVFFRLTEFTGPISPGDKIYITEAHARLPHTTFNLHDLFYTSQLPLGAFPRISNDKRHPGGINALFFDGHAETLGIKRMDAGWPNKIQFRLKWFTVLPNGVDR